MAVILIFTFSTLDNLIVFFGISRTYNLSW